MHRSVGKCQVKTSMNAQQSDGQNVLWYGLKSVTLSIGHWNCHTNSNLLWPPCVADADIIFLPCGFFLLSSIFFFYSSPNLSGRRLDVYHISTHGVALVRILECRSEMCCTRLAGNTGRKNDAKNRHLRTIAQLCRTISSQLRNVSTIGKKTLKHQYLLHMSPQYGELRAHCR